MQISTVIPTVGRATLARAVASAVAQDLGAAAHEVIVVNDSGAPLPPHEWMRSEQVHVIETARQERSAARNAGAAVARGRHLHFLDDDDFLLPGSLAVLAETAKTSGAVWTYGALRRVDDEGRLLSVDNPPIRGNLLVDLLSGEGFQLGSSLIDAEAFHRVGGFDEELVVVEDRDLAVRLAMLGEFERVDKEIVCVRVGPTGATTTQWSLLTQTSRRVREQGLDAPGALARMLDAVAADAYLRGRAARCYAVSLVGQALQGRIDVALRRVAPAARVAALHLFRREFWRGFLRRSGTEVKRHPSTHTRGSRYRREL